MTKTFTKQQLIDANASLTKVATKFKAAQDGGSIGPEEVKEIAEETISVLSEAAEMLQDVAEGVPTEDNISEPTPEVPEEDTTIVESQDDDDDEMNKRLEGKITTLEATIKGMKEASQREKIATQYATLWPSKQQKGKFASIMKSKDSLEILQAKLDEAKSIVGSNIKQASMPSSYTLYDSFGDDKQRFASESTGNDTSMVSMKV